MQMKGGVGQIRWVWQKDSAYQFQSYNMCDLWALGNDRCHEGLLRDQFDGGQWQRDSLTGQWDDWVDGGWQLEVVLVLVLHRVRPWGQSRLVAAAEKVHNLSPPPAQQPLSPTQPPPPYRHHWHHSWKSAKSKFDTFPVSCGKLWWCETEIERGLILISDFRDPNASRL